MASSTTTMITTSFYIWRDNVFGEEESIRNQYCKVGAKIVTFLGQINNLKVICYGNTNTLASDIYMFGDFGEMMVAIATCA